MLNLCVALNYSGNFVIEKKKTLTFREVSLWVKEYLSNFDLKLKFINFVSLSWALQMPLTHVNMRFIPFSRLSRYFRNIKAVLRECDLVVVSVVM